MNFSGVQDLKKQQQQQKHGKWNSSVGEPSNLQSKFSYFVKLAPESPGSRGSLETHHDESSYDSFHNWETDVCKDSEDDDFSDSGSSKTEGYAVLDVEYEVASTSDDETASSVSSGTDEFAIEAATNAFYEFNALVNGQLHDEEDDDDEFILADTEDDSDGSIDLELGQADYWKCVKCNNKQNNPLYRYCEKCYQVRKSLFPPRPKRQRKVRGMENNRKRKMAPNSQDYTTSELDSDSEFDSPVKKKLVMSQRDGSVSPTTQPVALNTSSCMLMKNGNQKDKMNSENSKHAANSAGELSCNNSSSEDDDGETSAVSIQNCKKSDLVTKIKVSPSASIEISKVASFPSTSLIKLESSPVNVNGNDDDDDEKTEFLEFKVENKIIQNVYRQELRCSRHISPPKSLEWKDSGVSSCQDSSQEFSSSPVDEGGYLARTPSSSSTRSIDSAIEFAASQASTQVQQDTDDETDSEGILTRVEEFTKERQEKMREDSHVRPTISDSQLSQLSQASQVSDDFTLDINDSNLGICRFCMVNPKNGVFVHSNCLHLCCCYKCAVKVWKKRKSCPICNCKIKNVTKIFVH